MTTPGSPYELRGFAIPDGLTELHELLEGVSAEHPSLDPMAFLMFETAVTEIANNVIEHGRPQGGVRWKFSIAVDDDRLTATLSDSGQVFTGSLDGAMPDELAEGGRGLALAKSLLDELTYERADGENRWRLVRVVAR